MRCCASLFLKEIFVFSKNLSLMSEIARMFHRCKLRDYANYLKWKCKDHLAWKMDSTCATALQRCRV